MILMNTILTICILMHLALVRGCDMITPPGKPIEPLSNRIYFNSFESSQDTIGWEGYSIVGFRNDTPPGGGNQSVEIAGACLHPHAFYELPPTNYDRSLILQCWGKNLAVGGMVELAPNPESVIYPHSSVIIQVQDSVWRFYRSDTLFCPLKTPLLLSMSAGGYIPSAMLVDLLEIIKVE